MVLQEAPRVAIDYAADQRKEIGAAVAAVRRLWSRVGDDFAADFLRVAPQIIAVMNTAQARIVERAEAYAPEVLAATGQARADRPEWQINSREWVGTAGDGYPTESLAYGAVTHAKEAVGGGATTREALQRGGSYLTLAVGTALADTRRGVEGAATFARPVSGYVRMLTPPSCGRCIILAGKRYAKNAGFQRHPGCDCVHIPAAESIAGDMTVNADAYLGSLDDDALAKALGSKKNAEAYREFGADPFQISNAYRKTRVVGADGKVRYVGGVQKAQLYGRNVKYTLEGTTVRGVASHQMRRVRALSDMAKDGRYRRVTAPRLMPESIFALAKDKAHAERLLRDHGWLGITR